MSVAMIAKPLGAIIFGRIGDIHGRSKSFQISLVGTSVASLVIFLCPSYENIGVIASLILLLYRMCVCSFVSAGADGVRIFVYENISNKHKCLGVAITTLFTQAGTLLASISAWYFTQETMPQYAWKISFAIGGLLGALLLYVMYVTDFSNYEQETEINQNSAEANKTSLSKLIKNNFKFFVYCIILAGSIGAINQFVIVFFGTYHFEILDVINRSDMQKYIILAIVTYMIFGIIAGVFADKFGFLKIAFVAIILLSIATIKLIYNTMHGNFNPSIYIIISSLTPFATMPSAVIYKESIPKYIRYRLFAISHAFGSIIINSPTSYIMTLLYYQTKINWLPFVYFIFIIFLLLFSIIQVSKSNSNE